VLIVLGLKRSVYVAEITLIGIKTDIHWQLACEAAKHADKDNKVTLVYETPKGEVTLTVKQHRHQIIIRRQK